MPIPLQSQIGGDQQFMQAIQDAISAGIRVAMPGIIISFDPDAVTAVVQPAIKGYEPDANGNQISVSMSLLVDVPVAFPRGGGCTLTFPVKAGDECELIFNDRCIDFWWQNGGEQEPVHQRQHHIGDAIAFLGPMSQSKKISGISTSAVELRSDDGATKLSLNPSNGTISGTAPGGFNLNGLKILPDGRLQLVGGSIVDGHRHGGVASGGSNTAPLGG